jgi:hypothetical protein
VRSGRTTPMTMRRRAGRQQHISAWGAVVCSVAFFGAGNYCTLEAFAAQPSQACETPHAAIPEHHDEGPSAPTHHSDAGAVACCSAMQAIAASRVDFRLTPTPAWQLHPFALQPSRFVSLLEPSRTANDLSPPPREPTPARPFYRTTFASHAPPVSLA